MQSLPAFGTWNPARPYARAPGKPESRVPWPLILVIVVAAAIGVGAVWLWMGTHGARRAPADAITVQEPASLPVAADAGIIDASPTPEGVPPGAAMADAGEDPEDAQKEIEMIPEADAGPAPKRPVEAPKLPGDAKLPASGAPPGDGSRHAHGPTDAGGPHTASASPTGTPRSGPDDVSMPEPTPSAPAPANPPASTPEHKAATSSKPDASSRPGAPTKPATPSFDSLHALYEANDHSGVVHACSATTVTAAIANVCMLAACHTHDTAKAQRWLSLNPAPSREKLVAYCKQLGTPI